MARKTLEPVHASTVEAWAKHGKPGQPFGVWNVGGNLYLQRRGTACSLIARYKVAGGKARSHGLGTYTPEGLTAARAHARQLSGSAGLRIDQLGEAQAAAAAEQAAVNAQGVTFGAAADGWLKAFGPSWSKSHRDQIEGMLRMYCGPLDKRPVASITKKDVQDIVEPIWHSKPTIAPRLLNTIFRVIARDDHNAERERKNPAQWRGAWDQSLPRPTAVHTAKHYKALPAKDAPAAYAGLAARDLTRARAFRFMILTASRSHMVREARWSQIDFDSATWTVQIGGMKNKKQQWHCALCDAAVTLLKALPSNRAPDSLIFPGVQGGLMMEHWASNERDTLKFDCAPHGFRTTFTEWAHSNGYSDALIDAATAHVHGSKTARAYARSPLLEERRPMMNAWCKFVTRRQ